MLNAGFDPNRKTVVILSGYFSEHHEDWLHKMKNAWLELGDFNVILVSWRHCNRIIYDRVVANTPLVARQISMFLYYLAQLTGASIKDEQFTRRIHIIGHSLGAHIAGFIGQDLGGKVGRITGLDPAGPSFDKFERNWRLDWSDAILVEAFHTNMGKMRYMNMAASSVLGLVDLICKATPGVRRLAEAISEGYSGEGDTAWFGIQDQVGHIDYHVNNGKTQPGCKGLMHTCDHMRAHAVYQSILEYEIKLMKARPNIKARPKEDRLLAFRSVGHDYFKAGKSMAHTCSSLLTLPDTNSSGSLKSCSVPIDPLANVDELRRELEVYFGLNMQDGDKNPRLFFNTRAEDPFVADHYLLNLNLKDPIVWSNKCALEARIIMADENQSVTKIKLNQAFPLVDIPGYFRGLAIPFVHPNGAMARIARDDFASKRDWSPNLTTETKDFVPVSIELEVMNSDSTGITSRVKQMIIPNLAKCILTLDNIEIKSVTSSSTHISEYTKMSLVNPKSKLNVNGCKFPVTINKGNTLLVYEPVVNIHKPNG